MFVSLYTYENNGSPIMSSIFHNVQLSFTFLCYVIEETVYPTVVINWADFALESRKMTALYRQNVELFLGCKEI